MLNRAAGKAIMQRWLTHKVLLPGYQDILRPQYPVALVIALRIIAVSPFLLFCHSAILPISELLGHKSLHQFRNSGIQEFC